jgi:Leucine-rich repeat (LRR) protein
VNIAGAVGSNQLAELLAKNCSPLQNLWLGDNCIQTFPRQLLGLTNLQRLHLNENKISQIPNELALSPSLQHVDLDHNFLSDLPESVFISGIKRLPGPRCYKFSLLFDCSFFEFL